MERAYRRDQPGERASSLAERPTSVAAGGPEHAVQPPWSEAQARFSPPKISETEVSSNTAPMTSAMMRATESTSSLSGWRSGLIGRVSVTTTREMCEAVQAVGGRVREDGVGGHGPDLGRTGVVEQLGGGADGARRVDHVVDQDAVPALDLTHDVAGLDLVGRAPGPGLVHQGQFAAEVLAVALGHLHPPGVGGHHHHVGRRHARGGTPRAPAQQ